MKKIGSVVREINAIIAGPVADREPVLAALLETQAAVVARQTSRTGDDALDQKVISLSQRAKDDEKEDGDDNE